MDDFEQDTTSAIGDESSSDLNPEYCEGPMRPLTVAATQPEAELIQGLLRTEGVPSTITRPFGVSAPATITFGGIDVYVPESALARAREILQLPADGPVTEKQSPLKLGLVLIGGLVLLVIVVVVVGAR